MKSAPKSVAAPMQMSDMAPVAPAMPAAPAAAPAAPVVGAAPAIAQKTHNPDNNLPSHAFHAKRGYSK
jgi:hypothetical protein